MNERDFVYWLNGFLELSGAAAMDEEQVRVVREHLALVLRKKTPSTVAVRQSTPPLPQPHTRFVGGVNCDLCKSIKPVVCYRCINSSSVPEGTDESKDQLGPLCNKSIQALPVEEATEAIPVVLDLPLHLSC